MALNEEILFPPIEPYETGFLNADDIHSLYWEQSGNPNGKPVIFLHGGPGSGASPDHRRFFDPKFYRIIIFDQRGAGRSTPLAELRNNSPDYLISDMEKLRELLKIKQWLVFGGSWGSTLALAYGEAHPEACVGFIIRGVFLMREEEIQWYTHGMRTFYPEVWENFVSIIPENERGNILKAYYQRLTDPNPEIRITAAKNFARMEGGISTLIPNPAIIDKFANEKVAVGLATIIVQYALNYISQVGEKLLDNLPRINHLPAMIIQGRYDMVCPPITAYQIAQKWPKAKLTIIQDAGHAATEPGIAREIIAAMEEFKKIMS